MEPSPEPRETISRFEKLLAALATNRVDFAVVGGLAVIFNGYLRLTLDADVLVDDRPDNWRTRTHQLERQQSAGGRDQGVRSAVHP